MNTIRAFIAIEIDPLHRQKISAVISHLKKADVSVKWVTEAQMHLTLKFLGNIEQENIQKISGILKAIAGDFSAFNIQFSKIGAFPNYERPRVIWMGIEKGSESLRLLSNRVEAELEKIGFAPSTSLGTGKERREYKVHLTLGRVKSLKNIAALSRLINEADFQFQDEIKIDKLILFQSTLTSKGAIYTPLTQQHLVGAG